MSQNNNTSEIIVGLDIGTTKIACIVGRRTEQGKIEVLGVGKSESYGVERGVVSNIEDTVSSIKKAVAAAEESADVHINKVIVGIAGSHIHSYQHRGMLVRDNGEDVITQADLDYLISDMHKLAMIPGEEIIHVLPQEYIIDQNHVTKKPLGSTGVRLEADFHIITGHINAAKNIYRCVQMAGLEVEDLVLEPLASAESVLSEDEKEAGVVLVDIGGGTTDIAIFHDGIIRHTAVIPFGGNIVTEDIQKGCSIIKKQAEALKVKFGHAISTDSLENQIVSIPGIGGRPAKEISLKNLSNVIRSRMEEIIEQVYFEIKNSGYEEALSCGIVVTGGGSTLRHIKMLFEYETGLETRLGLPNEFLIPQHKDMLNSPKFATGIGLVIKGLDNVGVEAPELGKTKKKKERKDPTEMKGKFFSQIVSFMKEFVQDETE